MSQFFDAKTSEPVGLFEELSYSSDSVYTSEEKSHL